MTIDQAFIGPDLWQYPGIRVYRDTDIGGPTRRPMYQTARDSGHLGQETEV